MKQKKHTLLMVLGILLALLLTGCFGRIMPATDDIPATESAETAQAEEILAEDMESQNPSDTAAFYGVWICAAKQQEGAEEVCAALQQQGYAAEIVYSADWSNLNQDGWYCVTAGRYADKESADYALSRLQGTYADAYVKYSGDRIG